MGWSDSHLHEFRLKNPATGETDVIGIPGEEFEGDPGVHDGWRKRWRTIFLPPGLLPGTSMILGITGSTPSNSRKKFNAKRESTIRRGDGRRRSRANKENFQGVNRKDAKSAEDILLISFR
jgi:hypothetical protein